MKPSLHGFPVKLLEALHLAQFHHSHGFHDLVLVFLDKFEAQEEEESEVLEDVRVLALHQLDVILSHLEGCPLEVHVPGRARQHEAEVDVDDVPGCVDQDVVVVPVFYLEQVLDQ